MYFYFLIAIFIAVILIIIISKLDQIKSILKSDNLGSKLKTVGSQPVPQNSSSNQEKTIPKIIIQTWKTNIVPQRYISLIDSVKSNNPDYEYLFFTDESIEKFFRLHYPEYLSTYSSLPIKIQKIDFFRYVAVYHYGGFYLDLDMNCLKSFDDLLNKSCVFPVDEYIDARYCQHGRYKPFCDAGQNFLLGQYAFAASPKHPFIKELIDNIYNNINRYIKNVDFNSEEYIYKTTGPDYVTEIYMKYKNKGSIDILDIGKRQYFGNYAKHNYFGTWK